MIVNMIMKMKRQVSFLAVGWLDRGAAVAQATVKPAAQAARNPSLCEDSGRPNAQRVGSFAYERLFSRLVFCVALIRNLAE